MTTVVNTPGGTSDNGSSGLIIGIIVAIVVLALFFLYALPAMRQNAEPANDSAGINVDVDLPTGGNNNEGTGGTGGTQ